MTKRVLDQQLEALSALRAQPTSAETIAHLRRTLKDRSGYLVGKAAALTGEFKAVGLIPDLLSAFDRFLKDGAKTDPKCWAKNAIAQALTDLGLRDPAPFLRGMAHYQPEPVWGGQEDAAASLRGLCALGLVHCDIADAELLERLVDLLGDAAKTVRLNALRALSMTGRPESALLLRLKAIDGDAEREVVGECFVQLLDLAPQHSLAFVARFLDSGPLETRLEAAAALGLSREPTAVELLTQAWQRNHAAPLREAMLYALGACTHDSARTFLLSLVHEAAPSEAGDAVRALASGRFRERCRDEVRRMIERRKNKGLAQIFAAEFEIAK